MFKKFDSKLEIKLIDFKLEKKWLRKEYFPKKVLDIHGESLVYYECLVSGGISVVSFFDWLLPLFVVLYFSCCQVAQVYQFGM